MAGPGNGARAGRRRSRLTSSDAEDRERPLDILADRARQLLTIEWADGHQSAYGFEQLRWACPCAACAGEAGLPGKLASTAELTAEQVTMSEVEAVGLFGIRPYWQDGHNTGIFGLRYLRSLCSCEECASAPLPHTAGS